jgi:predicted RNA methylase
VQELFPSEQAKAIEVHAELRAFERDYTPRPVAMDVVTWYFDNILAPPEEMERSPAALALEAMLLASLLDCTDCIEVLDTNAGAGVWASCVRRYLERVGARFRITAVEINPDEAQHLRRHADHVVIGNWRAYVERCQQEGKRFHLVIGNPAFSQARAQRHPEWIAYKAARKQKLRARKPSVAEYMPETSMPALMMTIADAVILYTTQQSWTKTESGYSVALAYPPAVTLNIPGSISHRVGSNPENGKRYGADSVPYATTMWLAGVGTAFTEGYMLPPLSQRSWRADLRPGAEPDEWLAANGIPTVNGDVELLEQVAR